MADSGNQLEPTKVSLDISPLRIRSSYEELMLHQQEGQKTANVKYIVLNSSHPDKPTENEDLDDYFERIRSAYDRFPNHQALIFDQLSNFPLVDLRIDLYNDRSSYPHPKTLNSSQLAQTLLNLKSLQTLVIRYAIFVGNSQELGDALRDHPSLREIGFDPITPKFLDGVLMRYMDMVDDFAEDYYYADKDVQGWQNHCWRPVMAALATCQQLVVAKIDFSCFWWEEDDENRYNLTVASLGIPEFCSSNYVEDICLDIESHNLGPDLYESMFDELKKNHSLKKLRLRTANKQGTAVVSKFVLDFLEKNNCPLEEIYHLEADVAFLPRVAPALMSNNPLLTSIDFGIIHHHEEELIKDSSIKPFGDLVEGSLVLESLNVKAFKMDYSWGDRWPYHFSLDMESIMCPKIPFFLKLNKGGRRKYLLGGGGRGGASCKEWVETIIANKENVAVVFYYLSMNPSLLNDCYSTTCSSPNHNNVPNKKKGRGKGNNNNDHPKKKQRIIGLPC